MVCKSTKSPINLSFSGCGFLGIYHIGVISAFKEHAPEVLENKMAGCSAGALAAACSMSGCCLGQMCSDVLEITVRARSRALGPLHPTFNIVEIMRNGLRRILPPNAHEICSGRLFISLTRWKDNKNVIINQYHTREELIQVLICTTFVPYWSGMIPHKFHDEYYWDGGLSNNNPILDENTIIVSPFAGESDICPRDESGSFYSLDFCGTDISCTQENLFRMTRALFPPTLSVLKQVCWRGYIDALKFLQTRNMIKSARLNPKSTISSVLGDSYTEPPNDEEKELANGGIAEDVEQMYEDLDGFLEDLSEEDEEEIYSESEEELNREIREANYSSYCEKVTRKKELPTPIFAVFSQAKHKVEEPIGNYFTGSKLYRIWSFMTLPVTLPIDVTYAVTKRVLGVFRPTVSTNRAVNFLWSFFGEENDDQYCYHVHDCECTESRPSSVAPSRRRRRSRPSRPLPSHLPQQTTSVPPSTGTYSQSECPTDEENLSVTHSDEAPDLVTPAKPSNLNEEYVQHLQQMADYANQQILNGENPITPIPFFGKDDHVVESQCNELPTSTLEKNVLFNTV